MGEPHYRIEHWTRVVAEANPKQTPTLVKVDDRAATRQAILNTLRGMGVRCIERSEWHAKPRNKTDEDWDYSKIAIHHAGRGYRCGTGMRQMASVQAEHRGSKGFNDIGYHYALDCSGDIYEGSDIRFKGSHILHQNTAKIGIVLLENLSEPEEISDRTATVLKLGKQLGLINTPSIPASQRSALQTLIKTLRIFFKITTLGGHSEFAALDDDAGRSCPGIHGLQVVNELRSWSMLSKP